MPEIGLSPRIYNANYFCTLAFYLFSLHPLYFCFMSTDIGAHKYRLFGPFVLNIEIVLSGLYCTLCFCSSCHVMIGECIKTPVLFSFNLCCLYITCDVIYVNHGNTITFIVIVIIMCPISWWRHQMETFPRYWSFVRGIHRSPLNSPDRGPVTRSFDIFFDLRLNKWLSKPSRRWWFETPSRSVWRHCNVIDLLSGRKICTYIFWAMLWAHALI